MNIWKNLKFTRFFISFTIGNLGDWFDVFALQIIFVHEWHVSPVLMSILILSYFLPSVILSPIAGVFADRVSKRNLMLYTDGCAALLTIGLYFSSNITAALVLLIIRSCVVSFNVPAQQAYVKHVVTDKQLLKASSYTTIVFQMCKVVGPVLGAAVLIYMSARMSLAINALSFIISVLVLVTLPKDNAANNVSEHRDKHWKKDVLTGIIYIWNTGLVRVTLMLVTAWFFCSLVRQTQLAIFLKHLLPHHPNALGIFMGIDGFGAVITSMLLSRKKAIQRHDAYFSLGFLLLGLGILGLSIYQATWPHYLLYLLALIIGLGTGIQLVNYSYIIKKATPNEHMGRVSGAASALQNAALTMGTLSSGFLVLQFGIREVYLGLAAMMLILSICSVIFMRQYIMKVNPL
jgi:MFS family permease